ncbi:MAG: hypothetical protein AAFZ52_00820 [Bacteroidota bacterium]
MAKYLLEAGNFNWLAIFALLTFFCVFALALFLVIGTKRSTYEQIGQQPLVDSYLPNDKTPLP